MTSSRIRRGLATTAVLAVVVLLAVAPASAAAPALDFDEERTPYLHASSETIATHDLGAMDAPLEFYDDQGEVTTLPGATYNESQQAPFGVRWDKVDAAAYRLFPRVDGETDNGATWTATAQWSTSSGTNSGMTITDADNHGVQKVSVDASVASGETATATFGGNVGLSDPNKRVLMTVLNVDTLASGATVEVRAVDGDGDYRAATIDTADTPGTDETSIANKTGTGYVMQETVGDLPLTGAGDGTLDGIETVEIVVSDANAKVTVAGLDLDKKSTDEFATIARDEDGDGEDEAVTFEDYWEGGESRLTEYSFGEAFSSAEITDWTVYDVRYPLSEVTDESEYNATFQDSPSSYAKELALTADLEAPAYIDLTHGTLSLRLDQGSIAERYGVVQTATVADDTAIGGLSDSDYTDRSGAIASQGDTVTLASGLNADQQYRVDLVLYLQDGEVDQLRMAIAGGPTTDGGGFFSALFGQLVGIGAAVAGAVGVGRFFRSG